MIAFWIVNVYVQVCSVSAPVNMMDVGQMYDAMGAWVLCDTHCSLDTLQITLWGGCYLVNSTEATATR